jgi:hypothetical protein
MDQKATVFTFRFDQSVADTLQKVCRAQPSKSLNGALEIIIDQLDASIRQKLDPEALGFYEAGKLDRTEWRRACVRYQRAKAVKVEEQAVAS